MHKLLPWVLPVKAGIVEYVKIRQTCTHWHILNSSFIIYLSPDTTQIVINVECLWKSKRICGFSSLNLWWLCVAVYALILFIYVHPTLQTFSVTPTFYLHDFSWWWSFKIDVRFSNLTSIKTAVLFKIQVFWDATPCQLVNNYWLFEVYERLHTFLPGDSWHNILDQINWQVWNCNEGFKV